MRRPRFLGGDQDQSRSGPRTRLFQTVHPERDDEAHDEVEEALQQHRQKKPRRKPRASRRLKKISFGGIGARIKVLAKAFVVKTTFGQLREAPTPSKNKFAFNPRWWFFRISDGLWNFGPTKRERKSKSEAIIASWKHFKSLVVVTHGGGGGTGKSTSASTIAQVVRMVLGGMTLLFEKNPRGTVASGTGVKFKDIQAVKDGHAQEACFQVKDAYRNRSKLVDEASIVWRFATMVKTGLYVLTHPDNSRLSRQETLDLIDDLNVHFPVTVIDSDQDFNHPDTKAVLEIADVIVLVTEHNNESRIEQTVDVLQELRTKSQYENVNERVILVVNKVWLNWLHLGTTKTVKILRRIQEEKGFELYEGPVMSLPWNARVKTKRYFEVRRLSRRFRLHALELTAEIIKTAERLKQPYEPHSTEPEQKWTSATGD